MSAERWMIVILLPSFVASLLLCRNLGGRLEEKEREVAVMKADAERLNAALAEREKKLAETGRSLVSSRRKLKELQNDKAVADWSSTPVPPAVSSLLTGKSGE